MTRRETRQGVGISLEAMARLSRLTPATVNAYEGEGALGEDAVRKLDGVYKALVGVLKAAGVAT
jgi:hypothetical protein